MRTPEDMAGERGGCAPWCGPAVLALAGGLSYAEACAVLARVAPERYPAGREIVTAWWRDLVAGLAAVGMGVLTLSLPPGLRLSAVARRLTPGWYLVRVTDHFLLLRAEALRAEVFDNRLRGAVLSPRAHGRKRVTHVARLGAPPPGA